jgi:hypothetical protein
MIKLSIKLPFLWIQFNVNQLIKSSNASLQGSFKCENPTLLRNDHKFDPHCFEPRTRQSCEKQLTFWDLPLVFSYGNRYQGTGSTLLVCVHALLGYLMNVARVERFTPNLDLPSYSRDSLSMSFPCMQDTVAHTARIRPRLFSRILIYLLSAGRIWQTLCAISTSISWCSVLVM